MNIAVLLIVNSTPILAQVPYEQNESPQSTTEMYSWTKQAWSGNDTLYRRARAQIDTAVAKKQNIVTLARTYYVQAEADLLNPLKQFRWAYASYQATRVAPESRVDYIRPLKRLQQFHEPYNYEFARLRFILESKSSPRPELKVVGRKLAQRNPKDYDILFYLVLVLDPALSNFEKQEALSYSQSMLKLAPTRLSAHTTLGFVYFRSWLTSKSRDDSKKSIAAYEQYLKLAPQDDGFRLQAMKLIYMMKRSNKA